MFFFPFLWTTCSWPTCWCESLHICRPGNVGIQRTCFRCSGNLAKSYDARSFHKSAIPSLWCAQVGCGFTMNPSSETKVQCMESASVPQRGCSISHAWVARHVMFKQARCWCSSSHTRMCSMPEWIDATSAAGSARRTTRCCAAPPASICATAALNARLACQQESLWSLLRAFAKVLSLRGHLFGSNVFGTCFVTVTSTKTVRVMSNGFTRLWRWCPRDRHI